MDGQKHETVYHLCDTDRKVPTITPDRKVPTITPIMDRASEKKEKERRKRREYKRKRKKRKKFVERLRGFGIPDGDAQKMYKTKTLWPEYFSGNSALELKHEDLANLNVDGFTIKEGSVYFTDGLYGGIHSMKGNIIYENTISQDGTKFEDVLFKGCHITYNECTSFTRCTFIDCKIDNFVKDVSFDRCYFEVCRFDFINRKVVEFYECEFRDVTAINDDSSPTNEMVYMEGCDTSGIWFIDGTDEQANNKIMRYIFVDSYILDPLGFESCQIVDCEVVVKSGEIKTTVLNKCIVKGSYIDDVKLAVLRSDIQYSEFFRGAVVSHYGNFTGCIYLKTNMFPYTWMSAISEYKQCEDCGSYYHNVCESCIKLLVSYCLHQQLPIEICMIIDDYYDTTPRVITAT